MGILQRKGGLLEIRGLPEGTLEILLRRGSSREMGGEVSFLGRGEGFLGLF